MSKLSRPRYGSLQFWPRKRADRFLPSVNWEVVPGNDGLLGFIAYKAGMATAIVKDSTPKSMTLGKKMAVPVTILEVPPMKIYSVRFYKNGKVVKDVIVSNDKELKRVVKVAKNPSHASIDTVKEFDYVHVIVYSIVKEIDIKKTPDLIEVGVGGKDKLVVVKNLIGKELKLQDFFKHDLVDARGLTKGKGLSGPVARFGISLRAHKSEKGRRGPGSLGPWHPARVIFRVPISGQLGMFTRVHYNLKVLAQGAASEGHFVKLPIKNFGAIKTNYIIVHGSVQGPAKRQLIISNAMRSTKKQVRKKFELIEVNYK